MEVYLKVFFVFCVGQWATLIGPSPKKTQIWNFGHLPSRSLQSQHWIIMERKVSQGMMVWCQNSWLIFRKYFTHTHPADQGHYKSPFQFGSLLECSDKFFQVSSRKIWSGMEWSWNLANLLGKVTVSFRWLPGQPGAVPEHNGQLQYCWFGATPLIHNLWIPASFFSLCILTHFTKQNVPPKLQYNFCFCGRCVHHTWR
jgi:hypothetical protein